MAGPLRCRVEASQQVATSCREGLKFIANGGSDSPVVKWLKSVQEGIKNLINSDDWKTLFSPDTSVLQKVSAAWDLTIGNIDRRINQSVTSDDWHVLLYGTHVNGSGATPGDQFGALDRIADKFLTDFDAKLRANQIPVTWGDWWESYQGGIHAR